MPFDERAGFIIQSIASHDHQIGDNASQIRELREELKAAMARTHPAIDKLVAVRKQDAINIQALESR